MSDPMLLKYSGSSDCFLTFGICDWRQKSTTAAFPKHAESSSLWRPLRQSNHQPMCRRCQTSKWIFLQVSNECLRTCKLWKVISNQYSHTLAPPEPAIDPPSTLFEIHHFSVSTDLTCSFFYVYCLFFEREKYTWLQKFRLSDIHKSFPWMTKTLYCLRTRSIRISWKLWYHFLHLLYLTDLVKTKVALAKNVNWK